MADANDQEMRPGDGTPDETDSSNGHRIADNAAALSNAAKRLFAMNRRLTEANRTLEARVAADKKVLELSRSMTSLLTNMPAMTFSKDIATGKYLACNQSFADYAHKETPEGVVGLTDHEIFDQETADHFVEDDRIAMSMDTPYVFYEDVPDAAGNPCHLQTIKLKFVDQMGRTCTLGMSVDVTELVEMRRERREIRAAFDQTRHESRMYASIAGSLSADYEFVYCVDLETDEYVEYHGAVGEAKIIEVCRDQDFFGTAYRNAQTQIYEKDLDEFLEAFTKENIIAALDAHERFTLTYRLMIDGTPRYVSMKATRMTDEEDRIVIGVMNIDAQMKEREAIKRIREERVAYARISALTGDFLAIYSVSLESGDYEEYSVTSRYEELGIPKVGTDFFVKAVEQARGIVHPDDLGLFEESFTRENVLRDLEKHGMYQLRYRLLLSDGPLHVRLKAATVEEPDGLRLIVGVSDIDEQVKQDMEYERNLMAARMSANTDELTGVKNKHAYAELEHELDQQIAGGAGAEAPVEFALVIFDVNELKAVNDAKGHLAGDEYLRRACSRICETFKHSPVFRVGGDEFAVIARGQDYERIEELVAQVDAANWQKQGDDKVVLAYGMAIYDGEARVAELFDKADQRMYEYKVRTKQGR